MAGKCGSSSPEFQRKVTELKEDVTNQYALLLASAKIWIKRQMIKLKCSIELRKKIAKLSSARNLHIARSTVTE